MNTHTITGGGGLKLNVAETGVRGAPSLLFLHGISQNYDAWTGQLESELADEFHLAAFDLRGHGASEKPLEPAAYSEPALWAADVQAVIEGLELHRPILVAWSYGGIVALDYLKTFGDNEVAGLVMVAALSQNAVKAGYAHLGSSTAHLKNMFSKDFGTNYAATLTFAQTMTASPPSEDELRRQLAAMMMTPPQVRYNLGSRKVDHSETLSALTLPVLCLHGDGDTVVKVSSSEHTLQHAPTASLTMYSGVGHLPFVEARERFNEDLDRFAQVARIPRA
ncbi:alpha/beta hydrolase [soil metagenome]